MRYHLERRVLYSETPKHPGLNRWCMKEFDEAGIQIGGDLVPWHYSLYFDASAITATSALGMTKDIPDVDDPDNYAHDEHVFSCKDEITAALSPLDVWSRGEGKAPKYSMLGTDRLITDFRLHIEPLRQGGEVERCEVWGCPSYTDDVDVGRMKDWSDSIVFYMFLSPDRFAGIFSRVVRGGVPKAMVRVNNVRGFYARWTPEVSTGMVKVLTSYGDHGPDREEGSSGEPLRLGRLDELVIEFMSGVDIVSPANKAPDHADDDLASDATDTLPASPARIQTLDQGTRELLASVRIAAWSVVGLLAVILVLLLK